MRQRGEHGVGCAGGEDVLAVDPRQERGGPVEVVERDRGAIDDGDAHRATAMAGRQEAAR